MQRQIYFSIQNKLLQSAVTILKTKNKKKAAFSVFLFYFTPLNDIQSVHCVC